MARNSCCPGANSTAGPLTDAEDAGAFRQPLELVCAKVFEQQSRSGGQVANGSARKYFCRSRERSDASPDVDRQAASLVPTTLAFADVNPRPDGDAPRGERRHKFQTTARRLCRTVK